MSGNNISVFLTAKQLQDIVVTSALSTGLYGINVALSASCLHLLIVTRGHLRYRPAKVVAFYIYILGMLGFSTQAAVNVFQYFPGTVAMVNGQLKTSESTFALVMRDGPIPQEAAISLPFIILGYVLFMVWRCYTLYQGIGRMKQVIAYTILGLLGIASTASSIWFIVGYCKAAGSPQTRITATTTGDTLNVQQSQNENSESTAVFAFLTFMAATSVTITALISARLIYVHKVLKMSGTSPAYSKSPQLTAITVYIESSVTTTCATLITYGLLLHMKSAGLLGSSPQVSQIPAPMDGPASPFVFAGALALLPQICVMSPLLIIYRIVLGRQTSVSIIEDMLRPGSVAFRHDGVETQSSESSDHESSKQATMRKELANT